MALPSAIFLVLGLERLGVGRRHPVCHHHPLPYDQTFFLDSCKVCRIGGEGGFVGGVGELWQCEMGAHQFEPQNRPALVW